MKRSRHGATADARRDRAGRVEPLEYVMTTTPCMHAVTRSILLRAQSKGNVLAGRPACICMLRLDLFQEFAWDGDGGSAGEHDRLLQPFRARTQPAPSMLPSHRHMNRGESGP